PHRRNDRPHIPHVPHAMVLDRTTAYLQSSFVLTLRGGPVRKRSLDRSRIGLHLYRTELERFGYQGRSMLLRIFMHSRSLEVPVAVTHYRKKCSFFLLLTLVRRLHRALLN